MHKSCYLRCEWFAKNYKGYLTEIAKKDDQQRIRVIDVGGKDWNGQPDFFSASEWDIDVLDIQEGENVDIIPEDPYNWKEVKESTYDLALSLNSFQHIDYFWETIREMERVIKPGGLIYISAPSMRYDGQYPFANWANLEIIDHSVAGVPLAYVSSEWDHPLDDAVLIARKPGGRIEKEDWPHLSISRRYGS